jgi:nitronate monooxygenase
LIVNWPGHRQTNRPWGVGFLPWAVRPETIARALDHGPAAVMLSFGDPSPLASLIRDAGVLLIVQVTDLEEAQRALDAGADVIVAQGTEAGGHGGRRATLPLVPAVVDLVAPVPVLAAQGDDTERSRVLDIARDGAWPDRYTGRALRNAYLERWRDREDELRRDAAAQQTFREAAAREDLDVLPVWAGEGVGLVTELHSATELVTTLAADAEHAITRAYLARIREHTMNSPNSPGAVRAFSVLNGLTLLGVLLQAVWAGEFIDRTDRAAWVTVHEIGAFVVVVLALVTAVVAAATLRRANSALALGALAQLVLIVVQTGLGEAITEGGVDGLIVAHVPIAMLIFGLGIYLSIAGAQLRRRT